MSTVKVIPLGGFDKIGMNMTLIESGDTIVAIDCGTSFPPTNMPGISNSIPDSVMLAFYTSEGVIVNTGDFKFDMSPIIGEKSDVQRLSALGTKGVLAVFSDSTNAMIKGMSKSEMDVYHQLDWFFNFHNIDKKSGRYASGVNVTCKGFGETGRNVT